MDTSLRSNRPLTFRSEFRVCVVSTMHDPRSVHELLKGSVIPELRRRTLERGVLLTESDPCWEAMLAPARARSIAAARLDELHAHRPVFIGILGEGLDVAGAHADAGAAAELAVQFEWLRDMAGGRDMGIATEFTDRVLGSGLMRERAFFYILEPATAAQVPAADEASGKLAALVERVRASGLPVRDGIAGADELGRRILEDLLATYERLHPDNESATIIERERRSHEMFATSHRRGYVVIDAYVDCLDDHVETGRKPLVVTGEPGVGKSALLANWAEYLRERDPARPVICHYVGAATAQEDHGMMLRHVMTELKERCGIDEPVPVGTQALTEAFPLWLAQVRHKRLVLVLDALNQLDAGSHGLEWLPRRMPRNICLIVSAAPGAIVETLRARRWAELQLRRLTAAQSRAIIERIMLESGDVAASDLLPNVAVDSPQATPFFLRLRVQQARTIGATAAWSRMRDAQTPGELLDRIVSRFEEEFGEALVRDVLTLLWGARRGLTESDLMELTDDAAALAPFLSAFKQYLMRGEDALTFVHEHVRSAVEGRYIAGAAEAERVHRRLGEYFAAKPLAPRRLDEEPWQWERAGDRHRLVASLCDVPTFMALSEEDRRYELLGYWLRLGDAAMMAGQYRRAFEAWRGDHPDVAGQAAVAGRLGRFLATAGQRTAAEEFLRSALASKRAIHPEPHPDTAETLHELAELLRQTGAFAEAEAAYREVLAIREEQLAPHDPAIAQVLSDFGLLYRDWERHRLALPLYRRALDLKERIHGSHHPATAECLNDLALLYHDLRDFEAALALYRRSLEIREGSLGAHHPAVATSYNNLGGVCRDTGDFASAEEHYRRALAIREEQLGPDHPHTIITVGNLATCLHARGNYPEARPLFERALAADATAAEGDHPNAIKLRLNYAHLLRDDGDIASAEELLRQTLRRAVETLGEEHPLVAVCANNLAGILRRCGRDAEAAPYYRQAIACWEATFGTEYAPIGGALHHLGEICFQQGDVRVAEGLLVRALAIREQHLGPDHERTRLIRELLADVLGISR